MNERLINKIKKMFELANNAGATEGEADNAMRMANKLLEKHNLSMLDLHTEEGVGIKFESGQTSPWIRTVYNAVSKVYGCSYFYSPHQKCNYIVGTESDRISASFIIGQLIEDIKRAGKGHGADFKNGASLVLAEKCGIIIQERALSNLTTETGIALVEVYKQKVNLAREHMDENLNLGRGRSTTMSSSQAGRNFGRGLSTNARMKNNVRALN